MPLPARPRRARPERATLCTVALSEALLPNHYDTSWIMNVICVIYVYVYIYIYIYIMYRHMCYNSSNNNEYHNCNYLFIKLPARPEQARLAPARPAPARPARYMICIYNMCMYICTHVYIYIYIYIYTHTYVCT